MKGRYQYIWINKITSKILVKKFQIRKAIHSIVFLLRLLTRYIPRDMMYTVTRGMKWMLN